MSSFSTASTLPQGARSVHGGGGKGGVGAAGGMSGGGGVPDLRYRERDLVAMLHNAAAVLESKDGSPDVALKYLEVAPQPHARLAHGEM
jgi:hypothetical protein